VRFGPTFLQVVHHLAGDPKRGHGLDDACVRPHRVEQLAHVDAVQAARFIASQFVDGAWLAWFVGLHSDFVHSEGLHYHPIQGSSASYSP